jgi:hypothetical protein
MNELGDALGIKPIDRRVLESAIQDIQKMVENPPAMSCVNIFLNDNSALKYAIVKKIIMSCADITESEADWYLLMRGVEEELKKLSVLGVKITNDANN